MHKVVLLFLLACNQAQETPKTEEQLPEVDNNCICTMQYQPVCSSDKKQFSNPCMAECEGVKNYTLGECN